MASKGTLFIISAPSGAGKSSLISKAIENNPKQRMLSVSHTSRPPRQGEENGREYHFIDDSEFKKRIETKDFIEYAEVFGNYYGTSQQAINEKIEQGWDVLLDIDWQGAQQIRLQTSNVVSIYILPPSIKELYSRLTTRNLDTLDVIDQRMKEAVDEMSHYNEYDYIVINKDLDHAAAEFISIFTAERLKSAKQVQKQQELIKNLLE
jgi:guanylate kinase